MTVVSWIIVFIPFIFMSVIVTILLYVFGLDAATGTLNFKCNKDTETNVKNLGNLIYSNVNSIDTTNTDIHSKNLSGGSSDPQYR